jgi:hypothetical protein
MSRRWLLIHVKCAPTYRAARHRHSGFLDRSPADGTRLRVTLGTFGTSRSQLRG